MANQITIKETTFNIGDTIAVQQKIKEGASTKDEAAKTRLQTFQGIVISIKGRGVNKMFTVRRIASAGVGVERIWPANSPWLEKITVKKRGHVRRAKLYYLRQRIGKKATRVRAKSKPKANEKQASRRRPVKN